eukprot:scaffold76867_cov19-Tisochrysis_lutea.AAC.2
MIDLVHVLGCVLAAPVAVLRWMRASVWHPRRGTAARKSSGGAEVEEGERVVPKKGSSRGGAAEAADAQDGRKGGAMEVDADDRYQGRLRENCCWLISRTGPEQTGNVVSQEFLGGSPPLALVRI